MSLFDDYKKGAAAHLLDRASEASAKDEWQKTADWYCGRGRQLFIDAFQHEASLEIKTGRNQDVVVAAALPRSLNDLESKATNSAFYLAHGEWLLEEMDEMARLVPAQPSKEDEFPFESIRRYGRKLMLDSIVFFEDWGRAHARVAGVFGAMKNMSEPVMALYQGARQTIYGHGSFALSFIDNHCDVATATIRQAVELRLRRGFGVMGKEAKDGGFHPIQLSDLLTAMDRQRRDIHMPIEYSNVTRINSWANLYLHGGLKLYAWTPARVLSYLRPFLLTKNGIRATQQAFDAIQAEILLNHDTPALTVSLLPATECDIVIAP